MGQSGGIFVRFAFRSWGAMCVSWSIYSRLPHMMYIHTGTLTPMDIQWGKKTRQLQVLLKGRARERWCKESTVAYSTIKTYLIYTDTASQRLAVVGTPLSQVRDLYLVMLAYFFR